MDTSQRARALSDRLLSVRRDVRRAEHRLALLLAEMADADLHKALGYATIGEYAAVVLEVEPRQARELVRLGRRLPELPHLDAALAEGRLDWTKAREVIRVATPETDAAWVARAIEVSSRALEQDVADAVMGEPPPESASEPARAPARRRVVFEMEAADAEVLFQALLIARTNAGASRDEVEDGALLAAMARRFLHEVEPVGTPTAEPHRVVIEHCPTCARTTHPEADVSDTIASEARCDAEVIDMRPGPTRGHATRTIPPALRRAVFHRAHWRCEVPQCRNRLWLDLHHLLQRARGGPNAEWNLAALCSCHHRACHDGVLAVERLPDGAIAVTHADGRRIVGTTHVGRAAGYCLRAEPGDRGAEVGR